MNIIKGLIFILLGEISFGATMSIYDVLQNYEFKNERKEIVKKEKEIEIKKAALEKKLFLNKKLFQVNYSLYDNYAFNNQENNLSINLGYGIFKTQVGLLNKGKEIESKSIIFGIEKTLNSILYDENSYAEKKMMIKNKYDEIRKNFRERDKKREIVDLYIEIKNLEKDIENKNLSLKTMRKNLEYLNKKLEINEGVKEDCEAVEIEIGRLENNIKNLEMQKKSKVAILADEAVIEEENFELSEIEVDKVENDKIKEEASIEMITLNENFEIINLELEYLKTLNIPGISFGCNYDIFNNKWNAAVNLNGTIFSEKSEIEAKELEKQKYEIEMAKKEKAENRLHDIEILGYQNKCGEDEVLLQTKELLQKRNAAVRSLFEKGYIDMQEYIKEENNYRNSVINYEKNKNNLNGYIIKKGIKAIIN